MQGKDLCRVGLFYEEDVLRLICGYPLHSGRSLKNLFMM